MCRPPPRICSFMPPRARCHRIRKLHQIVAGNTRHRPLTSTSDCRLPASRSSRPVLVIERADEKSIAEIAGEIDDAAPEIRQADQR